MAKKTQAEKKKPKKVKGVDVSDFAQDMKKYGIETKVDWNNFNARKARTNTQYALDCADDIIALDVARAKRYALSETQDFLDRLKKDGTYTKGSYPFGSWRRYTLKDDNKIIEVHRMVYRNTESYETSEKTLEEFAYGRFNYLYSEEVRTLITKDINRLDSRLGKSLFDYPIKPIAYDQSDNSFAKMLKNDEIERVSKSKYPKTLLTSLPTAAILKMRGYKVTHKRIPKYRLDRWGRNRWDEEIGHYYKIKYWGVPLGKKTVEHFRNKQRKNVISHINEEHLKAFELRFGVKIKDYKLKISNKQKSCEDTEEQTPTLTAS